MPAVLCAAAVLDQHPGQMELDIQANHGGEGNMDRATGALPTRIPSQEIAHHGQVHLLEAHRRRRGRDHPRTQIEPFVLLSFGNTLLPPVWGAELLCFTHGRLVIVDVRIVTSPGTRVGQSSSKASGRTAVSWS